MKRTFIQLHLAGQGKTWNREFNENMRKYEMEFHKFLCRSEGLSLSILYRISNRCVYFKLKRCISLVIVCLWSRHLASFPTGPWSNGSHGESSPWWVGRGEEQLRKLQLLRAGIIFIIIKQAIQQKLTQTTLKCCRVCVSNRRGAEEEEGQSAGSMVCHLIF